MLPVFLHRYSNRSLVPTGSDCFFIAILMFKKKNIFDIRSFLQLVFSILSLIRTGSQNPNFIYCGTGTDDVLFLQVDSVVDIFARKLRYKGPATLLAEIPSPAESEVIRWTVGEKNKSVLLSEFDRNRYIFRISFFIHIRILLLPGTAHNSFYNDSFNSFT